MGYNPSSNSYYTILYLPWEESHFWTYLVQVSPFLVEECGSRPDHQSVICFLTILDSHLFTLDPWLRTYVVGDESFPSLEVQIWSVPSDICEVSSLKKYGCQFWMLCSSNVWFIDDIDVYWLAAGMQPLYWMPAIESLNIGFMSWGPQNHPSYWSLREIRGEKDILWMEEILHHLGW